MSNALLPSWANGTVKEAADMLARTAMTKKALNLGQTLSGAASKVTNWAKANPNIAKPLGVVGGAAALGGGLAGLSSLRQPKEERQTLRSMLRGALAGGALGGGGYAAMKATNLDKKLPGLYDKANKTVSDWITGGRSNGTAPGLEQADDILGTMGLGGREMDTSLIDRANKAEHAERTKSVYNSASDVLGAGMAAARDSTVNFIGDSGKKLLASPTGLALGTTGVADAALRYRANRLDNLGRLATSQRVASRGLDRLLASKSLPEGWAEELANLRHKVAPNELVSGFRALEHLPGREAVPMGEGVLLGRDVAKGISRAGRGLGSGKWGMLLKAAPYLAALILPTVASKTFGSSDSPIIRDLQQPQAPVR